MDMRGYGETDKPTGIFNYTMDKLVNDINELIPALGLFLLHDVYGIYR